VRVLSVTHGASVGGGVFDESVEQLGHELARWCVPLGPPSEPPSAYDAVMVFGGAMHPDQDARHAWLPGEVEFLRTALDDDVPLLGVCLGAQLIARAAGARVGPARVPEVGWLPLELTDDGRADPVLGTLPARLDAFQWHSYTFELPAGATELATSAVCTQAFRSGRAWGVQFHAEVTRSMIESWISEDGDELPMPVEELRAETERRIGAWNEAGRAVCAAFLGEARQPAELSAASDSSRDHSCHEPT
jgi:GMP synthase (glutamine-hydrolysing)